MAGDKVPPLEEGKKILKIEVLPEFSEVAILIRSLRDFFCKNNFPINHSNEICLVIEELAANTIMHGYKDVAVQDREKISIEVECNDKKKVSVLFKDSGIPFDPTLPRPSRQEDTIGGWGLMLVKNIMHSFKYERNGKYNILRLYKLYR